MALLEKTKLLLREHRIFPKRRIGQNFTIESSIFERMIDYASVEPNDVVLEIGAGLGFLTRLLTEKCKRVLAVESDPRLIEVLREQLAPLSNVEIIGGNVLKEKIPLFNKVVSTPPYQISSRLIEWLFCRNFDSAVLVFQQEFADRLAASIGSRNYGWLTVIAYYHTDVELLDEVSKRLFYPEPEVDSIIVRLKSKQPRPFMVKDQALFKQLAKILFTQRNRKIRNAIIPFIRSSQNAIAEQNAPSVGDAFPFHDKRVRELAPEDFGVLANVFTE